MKKGGKKLYSGEDDSTNISSSTSKKMITTAFMIKKEKSTGTDMKNTVDTIIQIQQNTIPIDSKQKLSSK